MLTICLPGLLMRFTRKTLATLALPAGKPYAIFWDSDLPGFGIRLNPTGKVWVVQYRIAGQTRRETIGRVEAVSLEAARDSARDTLARVQLGADPRAERAEAKAQRALTFQAIADRYLKGAAERLKSRSYDEVSRHLLKDWGCFANVPLKGIDRGLISIRLEEIAQSSGPIAANRARASLSTLYSFALGLGLCEQNPVIGTIKPGREIKRDHVVPDVDISAIWQACGVIEYGRIVKLLLLTGQRRDEVGNMLWSAIDLEKAVWTLPSSRTKNRRSHEVPLSAQCLAILSGTPRILGRDHVFGTGQYGFSGWSKGKIALDARIGKLSASIQRWRLHDLRRTAATGMATLGVPPHIVEAALNHISGARAGVAGVYNRAAYRDEKRDALTLWANHVEGIVS
jgi:integrase